MSADSLTSTTACGASNFGKDGGRARPCNAGEGVSLLLTLPCPLFVASLLRRPFARRRPIGLPARLLHRLFLRSLPALGPSLLFPGTHRGLRLFPGPRLSRMAERRLDQFLAGAA